MRYMGRHYTGKGVKVSIIDSGIDLDDPRLAGARIEGWSIKLGATGHAMLEADYQDQHGPGTEIAAAIHRLLVLMAPELPPAAAGLLRDGVRLDEVREQLELEDISFTAYGDEARLLLVLTAIDQDQDGTYFTAIDRSTGLLIQFSTDSAPQGMTLLTEIGFAPA